MDSMDWAGLVLLAACAGALVASAIAMFLVPRGIQHGRVVLAFGVATLGVGAGSLARAGMVGLQENPEASLVLFRIHYVAWAVAAAAGPAILRALDPRRGFVAAIGAPVLCALFVAFVSTPAFVGASVEVGSLPELGLRWAFVGLLAVGTVAAAATSVRMSGLAVSTSQRAGREIALALAFAYLLLAALQVLEAGDDTGILGTPSPVGVAAVVSTGWAFAALAVHRTTLKTAERTVRHLRGDLDSQFASSIRDPLTGMFNRGYLFEAVHQALEQLKRTGETFAVCLADLDDFKAVNDTYGHPMGDLVLQTVAKLLMKTCRPYDTAARYGGEEFVVLLRNVDRATAQMVAERLRKAVATQDYEVHDGVLRVTATFGVVTVGRWTTTEDVIRLADEALYEGKHDGKNQVRMRADEVA
jgi:diguanylate cyclase (GGDEF)-like protein